MSCSAASTMSPRHGNAVSTIFSCGKEREYVDERQLGSAASALAAIYVEPCQLMSLLRTMAQSITSSAMLKECTVNHCALLHLLESGGNRTQDRPVSALHSTDGFRAHGNLTSSVDDGLLQRKCFKVGVLNFALFNMKGRGFAAAEKVLLSVRLGVASVSAGFGRARWSRGRLLSQRIFVVSRFPVGKQLHAAAPISHAPGRPICRTRRPFPPHLHRTHETAQHGFRVRARAPRRQ